MALSSSKVCRLSEIHKHKSIILTWLSLPQRYAGFLKSTSLEYSLWRWWGKSVQAIIERWNECDLKE